MCVKKLYSFSSIFILFYSSVVYCEGYNEVNFEFLIDNNLQSDYYKHAYTARGLWHWGQFNLGTGLKSYRDDEDNRKARLDVIGLFDVYTDGQVSVDLGAGFEGRSPKIEYAIGYHLSPKFSIKAGLRQVMSRDFEENYTDFSLGFIYTFPLSSNVSPAVDSVLTPEPEPESEQSPNHPSQTDALGLAGTTTSEVNQLDDDVDQSLTTMSRDRDIGIVDNGSYTVKKDDYLYKIARNHHVSIKYLLRINNIKQPDLIYPGQIIKL